MDVEKPICPEPRLQGKIPASAPALLPEVSAGPQDMGASVLVVDDEQLNLDMLSRRLRRSGFAVDIAASGKAALEKISERSFDLVLLDQMMPELSGADVLRILRKDYSAEMLPVIMVTAVAESNKIAEALESGANDYITKPVDYTVALARIRSQMARRRAELALRQSEERYALAARASQDGLWDWNLLSNEVFYSPRWKQMMGMAENERVNLPDDWLTHLLAADRQNVQKAIRSYVEGAGDILQCSYRVRRSDGSIRWMSCRGVLTRNDEGIAVRLSGSQSDVTEDKTHDALTGLPNRLPLLTHLEVAMQRIAGWEKPADTPAEYAVLFLDLDGFKTINDSLGHIAGDRLLQEIAKRLQTAARECAPGIGARSLVARMGGDEFAILLEGALREPDVQAFAESIQRAMDGPFEMEERSVHCIFSIGIALADPAQQRPEDVLRDADMAMYTAKLSGRGEMAVFAPAMREAAGLQLQVESDIWQAAERNQLVVYYQPKVDLATGRTYGVEALVRWNHPKLGLLQPGMFIPAGEKTGAIVEIGRWTLREACRQVRAWHKIFAMPHPLELSVNLSPREFRQEDLTEQIDRILGETDFPPASLHLEITETVLFEDMAAARNMLVRLKEMGIGLEIDDFGAGYSSLRYLRELPFDFLKIDRYFTANLDSDKPSTRGLIETIVSLANHLGLTVVAEGIETKPHSDRLQKLGCRFGQGYYFSKPVPAEIMQNLLAVCVEAAAENAAAADESSPANVPNGSVRPETGSPLA